MPTRYEIVPPSWETAARIYLTCVMDGQNDVARINSRDQLMDMAVKFDEALEALKKLREANSNATQEYVCRFWNAEGAEKYIFWTCVCTTQAEAEVALLAHLRQRPYKTLWKYEVGEPSRKGKIDTRKTEEN